MRRMFLIWTMGCASLATAADMEDLHAKIAEVCPIHGLSGNPADPRRIRIDFKPGATDEQRKAAFAIRNSFDYRQNGLADYDRRLDRLLSEAANRVSLDDTSFGRVYLGVQRAKLVRSPEVKQRFVLQIEKIVNAAAKDN